MDISQITNASTSSAQKARPTRVLVHSIEGWGKTWLASFFPRTVWIAPENGFPRDLPISPSRIPLDGRWEQMFEILKMLIEQPHDFMTLVMDTIDWIEPMIHRFVLARDSGRETEMNKKGKKLESIEDYGYGKGYIAAEEEFRRLIEKLDELQAKRNMHVVLLAHSKVKNFKNPAGEDYDRWEPKMHERITRVCVEWPETVLFGFYDLASSKIGDEKRAKGFSEGKRLVGLRYSAMYDAKNRLGLPPVYELPADVSQFVQYLLGAHLPGYVEATPVAPQTSTIKMTTQSAPAQTQQYSAPAPMPPLQQQQQPPASPPPASQQNEEQKTREARTWTEPKPLPQTQSTPAPAQTQSAPATTSTAKSGGVHVDAELLAKLTNALTLAKKKSAEYGASVDGWAKQAGGDPKKLTAIIDRVNKDCAGLA